MIPRLYFSTWIMQTTLDDMKRVAPEGSNGSCNLRVYVLMRLITKSDPTLVANPDNQVAGVAIIPQYMLDIGVDSYLFGMIDKTFWIIPVKANRTVEVQAQGGLDHPITRLH
jgi:hypothetical protein